MSEKNMLVINCPDCDAEIDHIVKGVRATMEYKMFPDGTEKLIQVVDDDYIESYACPECSEELDINFVEDFVGHL